jgi:hypothetical protein
LKIHDLAKEKAKEKNCYYDSDDFKNNYYVFNRKFSSSKDLKYEICHPRYPKQVITVRPEGSIKTSGKSGTKIKIIAPGHYIKLSLNPHNLVRFGGRERFIFGANLAWLDGQYGHDLSENVVIKGPNYLDPNKLQWNIGTINLMDYFQQMRDVFKCRIVRFWVFESCEGLRFPGGRIEMDNTMKDNIQEILKLAQKNGLYIYWCLLNSPPDKAHHDAFEKDKEIIRSAANPSSSPFFKGALRTFINTIKGHPNVFAVDVINEPENYKVNGGMTWEQIQKYIQECCREIKKIDGSILVSCGSVGAGWQDADHEGVAKRLSRYTHLGLDFYDFHIYNDIGSIINGPGDPLIMSYDELCSKAKLDKPCIIGEFGQDRLGFFDESQKGVVRNFIEQAWHLGYGGCLVWNYNYMNFMDKKNIESITNEEEKKKKREEREKQKNDNFRNSLIYDNGLPRPVSDVMSAFGTDYKNYTDI